MLSTKCYLNTTLTHKFVVSNVMKNTLTRSIHSCDDKARGRVADAYVGKSVLITGGTGFLGKVLIESLLYKCNDIENIYVLMRQKNGYNIEKRLEDMFDSPLFNRINKNKPEVLSKVIGVEGSLLKPELGIRPVDREELQEKVSIVFHSGAAVQFNDTFQNIFDTNYEGTKKVLELGKRMKNLELFMHISTAFAHFGRRTVEERVYPNTLNIDDVRKFIAEHGENEKKVQKLIGGCVNTYAFSKQLAEDLVEKERGNMPTIMIRPAQVTAMSGPPLVGWMDTWVGGPAMMSDAARGLVNVALGDESVICNLIPVDYVCDLIIVAAARGNKSKDMLTYNCCSSSVNPVTWKYCLDYFVEATAKNTVNKRPPKKFVLVKSELLFHFLVLVRETIPALFADIYLLLRGQKPRHLKSQKRPRLLRKHITSYTRYTMMVKTDQSQALAAALDDRDKELFSCDARNIVWPEYVRVLRTGIQEFMFNNKR